MYILTNRNNRVIYIGVTANLYARVIQHKEKSDSKSFTARYNCNKLVYYESFSRIEEAIAREKQLKNWHRQWKINLIDQFNPSWNDLSAEL